MTDRRAPYQNLLMPEGSDNALNPFGVENRYYQYPGELDYFRANPHVAGMAAEDDRVILNPYSRNTSQEQEAVRRNEAARIWMRNNPHLAPSFGMTAGQQNFFKGSAYENNLQPMRETLAARLLTGDPSAGQPTRAQNGYVQNVLARYLMGPAKQ
jgi:hypothetical protein